jgi:TetR/AcrR family transcriptional repressor of nem operon
MARKRAFDKDAALEQAMLIFWKEGYEATSTRALQDAMGISSSSMYETFGDKRSVFLAALARFCELERDQTSRMAHAMPTATQFIEQLFVSAETIVQGASSTYGSMAFNTMVEFGMRDADVTELLFAHYLAIAEIIAGVLARAQTTGAITAQEDPLQLAHVILSALQGFVTVKGMKPDFAYGSTFKQVILRLLNS